MGKSKTLSEYGQVQEGDVFVPALGTAAKMIGYTYVHRRHLNPPLMCTSPLRAHWSHGFRVKSLKCHTKK